MALRRRGLRDEQDRNVGPFQQLAHDPCPTGRQVARPRDGDEIRRGLAFLMLEKGVRHVVIREEDEIIGLVSARDVFRVLAEDVLERRD